uniref:Uncharacterized protein n=1 Tax=Graphocephala atropunctata TaxID=36148 RepID=A0A1B6LVQ9_9HEMI
MTLQNAKLTQDIQELKTYSEINYQSRIEELENDREAFLNKYNKLVENLNYIENQLVKEKQIRMDLTESFEDLDKEKEETICKLLNQVKHLTQSKTISGTGQDLEPKTFKDMETQTSNNEIPDISSNNLIFAGLANIKRKQDQAEEIMKTIQLQLQSITTNCPTRSMSQDYSANGDKAGANKTSCKILDHLILPPSHTLMTTDTDRNTTPGISQTCRQKLNTSVKSSMTKSNRTPTPGISQTCRQKLNTSITTSTPGTSQTCRQKLKKSNTQPSVRSKTNCFSISLQAAKYAANNITQTKPNLTPLILERKPPTTARIRPDNESLEEFFVKNIDFYRKINQNFTNKSISLHPTHDKDIATSSATSKANTTMTDHHQTTAEVEIHQSSSFLDHVISINHHQ